MSRPDLGHILVVDDETELMTALCEALVERGYVVSGFTDGQDAIRALAERDFDILLTDLMMPQMDGITLLRKALEIDPHIAGIIMTGQGTVQTAVEALKVGAFDYLLKPFKLNVLLPLIARTMEVHALRKENIELRSTMAIYDLTKAITIATDPRMVAHKVADAAMEQCRADDVSVMLPTEESEELYVAAAAGGGRDHLLGTRVKIGDVMSDSPYQRSETGHSLSMPMMTGGKLVGVLNVNSSKRGSFTVGQIKALNIIMSMAAPALENARLFRQIQSAEERYHNIFDRAVEGIFQSTPDGRFLAANPAEARMLGYDSPEELMASVTDIAGQLYVDRTVYDDFGRQLAESGEVRDFHAELYSKAGSRIWASFNARTAKDSDGNVLYYEGMIEDITQRKLTEEELHRTVENLRRASEATVQAMAITVERRDPYTAGHQKRVAILARTIAQEMGLSQDTVDGIVMAGAIHDIGKISMPAEILSKPGKLTPTEFNLIKAHSMVGYEILKDISFPWPIATIVLQHHERLDGSGYPNGLKADELLLETQILLVADVVEAMASHRPYRPALGIDRALAEILRNKGRFYNSQVVDVCFRLFREKAFGFEEAELASPVWGRRKSSDGRRGGTE